MKKQAAVKASKKTKSVSIADVKAFVLLGEKLGQQVSNAKAVQLFMAAK